MIVDTITTQKIYVIVSRKVDSGKNGRYIITGTAIDGSNQVVASCGTGRFAVKLATDLFLNQSEVIRRS